MDQANELTLTFKRFDDWDRPVYECDGQLYVDVDPRQHRSPEICTKSGNNFYGEPDSPVPADTIITFIPRRITW